MDAQIRQDLAAECMQFDQLHTVLIAKIRTSEITRLGLKEPTMEQPIIPPSSSERDRIKAVYLRVLGLAVSRATSNCILALATAGRADDEIVDIILAERAAGRAI